jgi:hypothetical protein
MLVELIIFQKQKQIQQKQQLYLLNIIAQTMSKYSTSTYAYDVEAQGQGMPVVPDAAAAAAPRYDDAATAAAPYAASKYDDEAGRRIGMAMFACIVVGYALQFVPAPFIQTIGLICLFAALVFASIITCGCCCAGGSKMNLNPKVKRWSTATLLCLVGLWLVIPIGGIILSGNLVAEGYDGNEEGFKEMVEQRANAMTTPIIVVIGILCFLAAVLASCGCCDEMWQYEQPGGGNTRRHGAKSAK